MTPRILLAACAALAGLPALAADGFVDDRSSPERVVASLYNAIDRHEYLRAWSYFREGAAKPYEEFRDGYAATDRVALRVGEVTSEGAAGSIHSAVPVAISATATDGTISVFAGCYHLTQVQPAIQDAPPYRPIQIDDGSLRRSSRPFAQAMGRC